MGASVVEAAINRMEVLYAAGHRVVVAFSGGKDSTVTLEIAIEAARRTGRLPVEVSIQEEEVQLPGTYEFVERTANRPEVRLRWLVMQQVMVNHFNRTDPYWWVMDPKLTPDEWVRKPPAYAEFVADKEISRSITRERYPVSGELGPNKNWWEWQDRGEQLICVMGLRVQESINRLMGLVSTCGYMGGSGVAGYFTARPVYDWRDGDVWKFIAEKGLDYNKAYDTLRLMGMPPAGLRTGPPTMNGAGIESLKMASKAWPHWFDRVAHRLPGIRSAAQFGIKSCSAQRRYGETWQQCFEREILGPDTPEWIRDRGFKVMEKVLMLHGRHASTPFPEVRACGCTKELGSWRNLCKILWNGDPFGSKVGGLIGWVEPEFFRPGAGFHITKADGTAAKGAGLG